MPVSLQHGRMQHQETMKAERDNKIQTPLENRKRLLHGHVLVGRAAIHHEADEPPVEPWPAPSLLKSGAEAVDAT